MKAYLGIVRNLDPSGFRKLGRGTDDSKAGAMYSNLWGLFGLTDEMRAKWKATIPKDEWPSVSDYAWTPEVAHAFYAHIYHRRFVSRIKGMGGMTWGMWVLDAEPACIDAKTGEIVYGVGQ
jgi:hypothetical protein